MTHITCRISSGTLRSVIEYGLRLHLPFADKMVQFGIFAGTDQSMLKLLSAQLLRGRGAVDVSPAPSSSCIRTNRPFARRRSCQKRLVDLLLYCGLFARLTGCNGAAGDLHVADDVPPRTRK